jgi:hypothetical protein
LISSKAGSQTKLGPLLPSTVSMVTVITATNSAWLPLSTSPMRPS